jgi:uncharacterized Zn finger protein
MLTFKNFKQVIEAQILTRGREYVRSGQIVDLEFDEETQTWDAQVEGSEMYAVQVTQDPQGTLDCTCTCPYDWGVYCKHVAAVLYSIEENFADQLNLKPKKTTAPRQTRHDKLQVLLKQASLEQLINIIADLAKNDSQLLNNLLLELDHNTKPTDYRRIVKDALRAGRAREGYLDYRGSMQAAAKIHELLGKAAQWIVTGEATRAVSVYQTVLEEVSEAINEADDSSGELGGCLSTAVQGLGECAAQLAPAEQTALFNYILAQTRRKGFDDWDWNWELLQVAAELVEDTARRAALFSALEDLAPQQAYNPQYRDFTEFTRERIVFLKLAVIEKFDGAAAARQFLRDHVQLDRVRMQLIEQCLAENALDEALRLIDEGIARHQNSRMIGLVHQYTALKTQVWAKSGNTPALIETTRQLWLSRGQPADYHLLKKHVPPAEWLSFRTKLIADLQRNPNQQAWLYAQEELWAELLQVVLNHPNLLETYRQPLEQKFPHQIIPLYEQMVERILERANGRKEYQTVVAYLQRIRKLGATEQVKTLVERIKTRYSKRSALLDELKRLQLPE